MRVDGTVSLDATRMPRVSVLPRVSSLARAGELLTSLYAGVRGIAVVLVRTAAGVLHLPVAAGPVVDLPGAQLAGLMAPGRVQAPALDTCTCCREAALPADATAPRQARALLTTAVADWGLGDDLHEDAAMVVTELVANAVDHAGTPSTLTVGLDGQGLRIAVRDAWRCPAPRPRPIDTTAPRGRGLQMIEALATSWGVTGHVDGKTVWAVLPIP